MFVGQGSDSIDDMLTGYVHAHADLVSLKDGAVVRRDRAPRGHVAVVAGGGAGHYPGFGGWVGPGMLDGAVSGQIFSSPSTAQVYRAARAVENGGGVLLAYLNYSGDQIHFSEAARKLREDGIDVEEVVMADDVASRSAQDVADGRGIAGALLICKILGGAAAAGKPLAEVAELGRRAAARTFTLGACTSGCTLPGAVEPLFTVEPGQLAVGLGIHGEPGIEMQQQGTPTELAQRLLSAVLAHEPTTGEGGYGKRAAILVNSLGGCSYEELFILYAKICELVHGTDLTLVAPVVGEQLTSLDMVGVSLSTMYLDEELEALWSAPVRTASLQRGEVPAMATELIDTPQERAVEAGVTAVASPASQELAGTVCAALACAADAVIENEQRLGALDQVGGDGDHGRGIVRGLVAARDAAHAAAERGAGLRTVLDAAGAAWSDKAGGTSGALWGRALEAFAATVDDEFVPTDRTLVSGLTAALDAVVDLGGARPGDKTMVDAMEPFVATFVAAADAPFAQTWAEATAVAERAAEGTADLVATKGRARTHGDKTLGTPDPGAISFGLVVRAAGALAHA